jgi:hypothetical protein
VSIQGFVDCVIINITETEDDFLNVRFREPLSSTDLLLRRYTVHHSTYHPVSVVITSYRDALNSLSPMLYKHWHPPSTACPRLVTYYLQNISCFLHWTCKYALLLFSLTNALNTNKLISNRYMSDKVQTEQCSSLTFNIITACPYDAM